MYRGANHKESEYKDMREELELFAHNLNVFMNRYGYTQVSLGEAVGNSNTTVNDWVHGRKFPRIDKLDKMCELFHCKRSDLLEKYTTDESIEEDAVNNQLNEFIAKLNKDGREHLLRYFEDMNPKFFKGGEEDVQ